MTNFRKPKECVNMLCMYKVHVKEQSGGIGVGGRGGGGRRKLALVIILWISNDRSRHTHKSISRFVHDMLRNLENVGLRSRFFVDQCTP